MGLPWTQADPAELGFAVLVPTDHVVAAAIFLDGHMAFWTLLSESGQFIEPQDKTHKNKSLWKFTLERHPPYLRICCNPVRSFTVIITFFNPLSQPLQKKKKSFNEPQNTKKQMWME